MREAKIYKHHYFRLLLALICLLITATGISYLIGSYRFFKTHFANDVSINGIDVSRMSKRKAFDVVNAQEKNWMVLRDGKIRVSYYLYGKEGSVSKADVNRYFSKQYSAFGNDKTWEFAPKNLSRERKALNKLNNQTVIYKLNGRSYSLKASQLFDLIHFSNGKYYYGNDDNFDSFISKVNKDNSTVHKQYQITDPDGQKVSVTNQSYGWEINTQATETAIKKAFANGTKIVDGDKYIKGEGINDEALGYGLNENHGLGNDFVLISLNKQKLWVYKGGQPVITLDDIVTGNADGPNATPLGVWFIQKKESSVSLKSKRPNGSLFNFRAQYWIPFTQDGKGISDANWRTNWGKDAYRLGTTNGNVNIKQNEMKSIWDNVSENEPVIVVND